MFSKILRSDLIRNPEFQSALVRIAIWAFSIVYIGLGAWTDYYDVNVILYYLLFGGYLVFFILALMSIYVWPVMKLRPYVTLAVDISASSMAIFLTKEAISPFYLLYIWIFVSYGTRYGKHLLMAASLFSVIAYNIVLVSLQQWQTHTFEAFFFLLLLVLLPSYQYSLLRQLHSARLEAERANKARGDFLATMTHELRTPLIGIIGMGRLMQGTPLDSEQKEYLHSILSSAQLLRALIGDILDFSKIDSNKLELIDETFDIRQLVGNVSSSLAGEAQEKQLELLCWVDPKVPRKLKGDNLRLSQILFNLLGNAIKFTDEGFVSLKIKYASANAEQGQPHVLFEISDTGIGIPQEKREKIFDMFWQGDVSNNRRFGGTGIGTTVARDLCTRMGGQISVESEVGKGTTFLVRLPMLMDQGVAIPVMSPQLEGKRILIYETEPKNMELSIKVSEELGMKPVPVASVEMLTPLLDQRFDVILICDSLHGSGTSAALSRIELMDGNPLVLMAGYRGRTVGLPEPVLRVLMKPFLADDLAEAILDPHRQSNSFKPSFAEMLGREVREGTGIQILLAEDNAIAAKVLSTLLIQRGHSVHITKDGSEALEATKNRTFHLAFIDLRMPRMDGIEFTRLFRQSEADDQHLPIYAMTANTAEDAMENCLAAGMDGFLNKPVEPEQLDAIIERHTGSLYYN